MIGWLWFLILFLIIGAFAAYAYFSSKKAIAAGEVTWLMKFWAKDSSKAIAASLISIVCGLLIGCIILIIMASLHLFQLMKDPDNKKLFPKIRNSFVAAVIIFFIPTAFLPIEL